MTGRTATQLPNNYSWFGKVTGGLEVAQKLESFADRRTRTPSRPLYIMSITVKAK